MLNCQAGVTGGPCPSCGQWISVPASIRPVTTGPAVLMGSIVAPPPATPAIDPPAAATPATRRKARVLADLTVDAAHLDRRETARSLVVIGMFILTACICAIVFYLMLNWASR